MKVSLHFRYIVAVYLSLQFLLQNYWLNGIYDTLYNDTVRTYYLTVAKVHLSFLYTPKLSPMFVRINGS